MDFLSHYIELIFVRPSQAMPIVIGVILWILLAGIGSLMTGKDRQVEINVLFGWAAVITIFTVAGVLLRSPFFVLTIILGLLGLYGIYRSLKSGQPLFVPGSWKIVVLALPLVLIAGAMDPSQWDEFSHWLPAPNYLIAFDGFPNAAQPYNGPHMLSAYPYAWPILSYLSAQIYGELLPSIGGVMNVLLLLTFTSFMLRAGQRVIGTAVVPSITWGFAAAVFLCATIFNPTFIQKIILTSYSDVSTAVVVGASLLITYFYLEALARRDEVSDWSRAWQLGLLLALLINLRQPNLVFALILLVSIGLIALRDPDIPVGRYLKQLPVIVILPLIVYLFWRFHVSAELANLPGGEAKFNPFDTWNLREIPLILKQMGVVAFKKIAYFAPMLLAVVLGGRAYLRLRTSFDRIAILVALVFLGYNSFLLLTYVAHFARPTALAVVSFWRYNTHAGMVAVTFIVIGAMWLLHHRRNGISVHPKVKAGSIVLALILPIVLAPKLRFDLEPPKPHFTNVAISLLGKVSDQSRIFVLDPKGTGESALITRFHLDQYGVPWLAAHHRQSLKIVREYLAPITENDLLLVHSSAPATTGALGLDLNPRESHLLKRSQSGWTVVRSWPKPDDHPW